METGLQHLLLKDFKTHSGYTTDLPLSYQLFGLPLHSAPVVLVNHALTGNSNAGGKSGWWNQLIGEGKVIDTTKFTILAFNIPGNGFDGFLIENFSDFTPKDMAKAFLQGLDKLEVKKLHSIIGGSLGGAIGWEMISIDTEIADRLIPVATHHKTSDWLHAQCLVQQHLLDHPEKALEKARTHAMLCYRTPESFNRRFSDQTEPSREIRKSQDWLEYHGRALQQRFSLSAYRLMNHLLMTIDAPVPPTTKCKIHLVAIDSDLYFPAYQTREIFAKLATEHCTYSEIKSTHGHDAFLMEYDQLSQILKPIYES